jgi:hypothetical protein
VLRAKSQEQRWRDELSARSRIILRKVIKERIAKSLELGGRARLIE